MCNGTFQHNFQPLEKETEIAINAVVDPDLQIGVCWGGGGEGGPVISGGGGAVSRSLPWVLTEMCMTLEGLLVISLTVNKSKTERMFTNQNTCS